VADETRTSRDVIRAAIEEYFREGQGEWLANLDDLAERAEWEEALGGDDHDEIQRDLRAFAQRLAALLRDPAARPDGAPRSAEE
jgi:hypothetical protein